MIRIARPLIVAAMAAALAAPALAQSAPATVSAARSADGHPNFDGVWNNASSTRLERPANFKTLVIPKEQADQLDRGTADTRVKADAKSDLSAGSFKDGNSTAGYNSFWTDSGAGLSRVRGEARSSFITEPEDGHIPFKDRSKSLALQIRDGREYQSGKGAYAGPEDLPLRERCLISQSDMGGPVMLNGLYNNNYEFHLTKDFLVIEVEMVHDARIMPIYASAEAARAHHKPAVIQPWLGDTVAWWEGDTLVAETRNVNPGQTVRTATPVSLEGKVTERFTRVSDSELLYQFRVEDPVHYSKPWAGEYSFKPSNGRVFEYACHEGNYAVPGILRGARMAEQEAAMAVKATEKPKTGKPGAKPASLNMQKKAD